MAKIIIFSIIDVLSILDLSGQQNFLCQYFIIQSKDKREMWEKYPEMVHFMAEPNPQFFFWNGSHAITLQMVLISSSFSYPKVSKDRLYGIKSNFKLCPEQELNR